MSPETWPKRPDKPEEADDSFMVSYSALMILLLTFMILLVTLANFKEPRFRKAIGSVRGAFSFLPYAGGDEIMAHGSPGFLPEKVLARATTDEQDEGAYERVVEEMMAKAKSPDLAGFEVEVSNDGLAIKLSDSLMFEQGRAELRPGILSLMDLLAEVVNARPGRVSIIGNTCDLPISNKEFPSNWELSIMRAVNVLHHLEARGVSPESLYAYGVADQRPIVPNEDEASRRENRRVEVYIANRGGQVDTASEVLH